MFLSDAVPRDISLDSPFSSPLRKGLFLWEFSLISLIVNIIPMHVTLGSKSFYFLPPHLGYSLPASSQSLEVTCSWECLHLSQVCSCSAEFPPCARDVVQTHQTLSFFLENLPVTSSETLSKFAFCFNFPQWQFSRAFIFAQLGVNGCFCALQVQDTAAIPLLFGHSFRGGGRSEQELG